MQTASFRIANLLLLLTAHPSGAHEFTPGFQWGSCNSIFSFMCLFCRSLFVLLYFFFWPLCCLFFYDSDYHFGIFKLFSVYSFLNSVQNVLLLNGFTLHLFHNVVQFLSMKIVWYSSVRLRMLNATFNNISVISWRSVLFVEETEVPGENHRPASSH